MNTHSQTCELCGKTGTDVRPADASVIKLSYYVIAMTRRVQHLTELQCCDACINRFRNMRYGRLVWGFVWLGLLFIAPCFMAIVPGPLKGAADESPIIKALGAVAVLGIFGISMFGVPVFIFARMRTQPPQLLGPETDEKLRALAGTSAWGMRNQIDITRPKRATVNPAIAVPSLAVPMEDASPLGRASGRYVSTFDKCPNCNVDVYFSSNGICPSCRQPA